MTGSSTEFKYRGIVPRAIAQVYHEIAAKFDQAITIRVSYIEIYNEMVSFLVVIEIRCLTFFHRFPLMSKMPQLFRSERLQMVKPSWLEPQWLDVILRKML